MDVARASGWAVCALAVFRVECVCVWKTESRIKNGECKRQRDRKKKRKRAMQMSGGSSRPNAADAERGTETAARSVCLFESSERIRPLPVTHCAFLRHQCTAALALQTFVARHKGLLGAASPPSLFTCLRLQKVG